MSTVLSWREASGFGVVAIFTSSSRVLSRRSRPCCMRRLNSANSLTASLGSTFTRMSFAPALRTGCGGGPRLVPRALLVHRTQVAPQLRHHLLDFIHLGARRDVVHLAECLGDLALGEAVFRRGACHAALRLHQLLRAMHLQERAVGGPEPQVQHGPPAPDGRRLWVVSLLHEPLH